MKTNVKLEAWADYYLYDDGTEHAKAGLFAWSGELDYPLLQAGVSLRLNGKAYKVTGVVVEEDGSQTVTCQRGIGYNRNREEKFAALKECGWKLVEEYHAY